VTQAIISSPGYLAILNSNIDDFDEHEVVAFLSDDANVFRICEIQNRKQLDAYSLVYRHNTEIFKEIYFNPIMLTQMKKTEFESEEKVVDMHVAFLTVRLVREVTHILHVVGCMKLRNGRTIKERITLKKVIDGKTFTDTGDLVEYYIFGGTVEHMESAENAFVIHSLVMYPFKGSPAGHEIIGMEGFLSSLSSHLASSFSGGFASLRFAAGKKVTAHSSGRGAGVFTSTSGIDRDVADTAEDEDCDDDAVIVRY
jgi:hypothetical protein